MRGSGLPRHGVQLKTTCVPNMREVSGFVPRPIADTRCYERNRRPVAERRVMFVRNRAGVIFAGCSVSHRPNTPIRGISSLPGSIMAKGIIAARGRLAKYL